MGEIGNRLAVFATVRLNVFIAGVLLRIYLIANRLNGQASQGQLGESPALPYPIRWRLDTSPLQLSILLAHHVMNRQLTAQEMRNNR